MSLGTRKTTFDKVKTGTEVPVQLAIVMEAADGSWLSSDILEQTLKQSLTKPAFTTGWKRVTATADADATAAGFQFTTEAVAGTMYYVGHNENFGNYRSTDADFVTGPLTPRLRIGLAHSASETDDQRKDVDFEAYRLRIVDGDGDAVTEADDVATVASSYGATNWDYDNQNSTPALKVPHKLFLYDLSQALTFSRPHPRQGHAGHRRVRPRQRPDQRRRPHHRAHAHQRRAHQPGRHPGTGPPPPAMVKVGIGNGTAVGDVFAEPPDEHRDLPNDLLATDRTCTITAWAVNGDNETISPVATLKVRPVDTDQGAVTGFRDYKLTSAVDLTDLVSTAYTVLK